MSTFTSISGLKMIHILKLLQWFHKAKLILNASSIIWKHWEVITMIPRHNVRFSGVSLSLYPDCGRRRSYFMIIKNKTAQSRGKKEEGIGHCGCSMVWSTFSPPLLVFVPSIEVISLVRLLPILSLLLERARAVFRARHHDRDRRNN